MMGAFGRYSSSRALLALGLLCGGACVDTLPGIEGTTSLRIEVTTPADLGAPDNRLDDSQRSVVLTATALDAQGEIDIGFSGNVDVYSHYLGSLTPELGATPLATAAVQNGVSGSISLDLPQVYGATFLWVEHTSGDNPTFATGTSDTLWYRDPFLADISRPLDETALDALEASPLEQKEVNIAASRYGDRGRLVVTGVYAQGYTVSDSECQDAMGTPPCVTGDYDHVFVFTFSRAEIKGGGIVQEGQFVERVSGGVSEFNGLTEIGFPSTFMTDQTVHLSAIPAPIQVQPSWLQTKIELERAEAALISVVGATVCPLDDDFDTYKQWKLDLGRGCDDPINVISEGVVAGFDPADYVGKVLPNVVGTLRPVNVSGGNFNVWIMFPRDAGDIALP